MPHTQDRAAASKAQERLERCQQRQLIDRERTAKARRGSVWLLVPCLCLGPSPSVSVSASWSRSRSRSRCVPLAFSLSVSQLSHLLVFPFWVLGSCFSLFFSYVFSLSTLCSCSFFLCRFLASSCSIALCASLRGQNGLVVWRGLEVKCAGKERWWLCFPVGYRASSHVTAVR